MTRAWVEVDTAALRTNFRTVRDAATGAGVVAMVKADGYGLGAALVVRALEPLEPAAWGVAAAAEGVTLRDLGVRRPILAFSPLPPADVETAAGARLTATVSDLDALERWSAAARARDGLDFHVEVDTGMGRAGFPWRDAAEWGPRVAAHVSDGLRWTGVYTHFHSSDEPDSGPSAGQWERFRTAIAALRSVGAPLDDPGFRVHVANSAAALRWPQYAADLVRPGIFLYGGDPAPDVAGIARPQAVAAVRARIVRIADVAEGATAGYGATHVARAPARWGTLSIGYGDGVPRSLGNRGCVIVRGRRVPIVGRISMDMTVVDITGVADAEVGDVATLIGSDGEERITVDEVAALAGTISYEILTGLTPRLPRVEVGWTGTD